MRIGDVRRVVERKATRLHRVASLRFVSLCFATLRFTSLRFPSRRVARSIDRSRYRRRTRLFASLTYNSRAPTHVCTYNVRERNGRTDGRTGARERRNGRSHLNRTYGRKKLLYPRPRVQLVCGRRMAPHRIRLLSPGPFPSV